MLLYAVDAWCRKSVGESFIHMVWMSVCFGMVVPVAKGPGYSLNRANPACDIHLRLLIGGYFRVCFLGSEAHLVLP